MLRAQSVAVKESFPPKVIPGRHGWGTALLGGLPPVFPLWAELRPAPGPERVLRGSPPLEVDFGRQCLGERLRWHYGRRCPMTVEKQAMCAQEEEIKKENNNKMCWAQMKFVLLCPQSWNRKMDTFILYSITGSMTWRVNSGVQSIFIILKMYNFFNELH